MDTGLKQRLVGAAVLVALAVIFLPMLVKGPAPDSGVSSVSLDMPDSPNGGMQTRDLPLVAPGSVPQGGAVGMDARPVDRAPANAAAAPADPNAPPADPNADPAAATAATDPSLPATTAGGNFAVHFGAYASQKGADTVATLAKAAQLPAYTEPTVVGGKPAFRVRIGPYATRAEAEAVRLKAMQVRSDVPVRVVALDAEPAPAAPVAAAEVPKPAEPKPEAAKPVAPKPADPKPVAAKPADPKPQPAKPVAPAAAPKVGFAVQVGVFSDPAAANAMRERLRAAGFTAVLDTVESDNGRLTRVRVGPVLDRPAADQLKEQLRSKAGVDGFVRAYP